MLSLEDLHLSPPVESKLRNAGLHTVDSVEAALEDGSLRRIDGIGEKTERHIGKAVNRIRHKKSPEDVDSRFFVVGCVMLFAALALAYIAFFEADLTADQRAILHWLLPLASGFGSGAFVGSLTVHSRGYLPGFAATAVGGSGVWLLTFFFFPTPDPIAPPDQPPIPAIDEGIITDFDATGLVLLTDEDRQSEFYSESSVIIQNRTQQPIRIGFSFVPRTRDPESNEATRYAHIVTEEVPPYDTTQDERSGFGGPVHVSVLVNGRWHPSNWFDFKIVSQRQLIVSREHGDYTCVVLLH